MYNGSRQSNNFTANAGGVGSTARVAISDVALKNASLDEVRAVTGHEIGHYVLKHTWWGLLFYSVSAIILFWLADRTVPAVRSMVRNECRDCASRAGFRCSCFIVALLQLADLCRCSTPSAGRSRPRRTCIRCRPKTARTRLSTALVKTAEYRYPRPGAVEEFLFYDHPSVERRVQHSDGMESRSTRSRPRHR